MANRRDYFFRQRVTEAELDDGFEQLEKAEHDLGADLAAERFLDLMLQDLGNPFPFDLSAADKRRLLNVLVAIYREKGTAVGIKNVIRFFLGLEVDIITYTGEGLVLGESLLGED